MFTTERQTYRLIVEKELLEKYYPGIRFNRYSDETYFESKATTRSGRMTFRLRIVLPFEYPHAKPKLYVWEPLVLRKWDGSSLNAEGMSHDFHTLSNGPGGRVQIDHCGVWDASMSCTEVLMRGGGYGWKVIWHILIQGNPFVIILLALVTKTTLAPKGFSITYLQNDSNYYRHQILQGRKKRHEN